MDKKIYLKKLTISSLVVLMPMISYLILGPLEIYCGNMKDFEFKMGDFFGYFLLAAVVVSIVAGALLALIPEKIMMIVDTVIFAVGVLSYAQYMIMNTKLSEDNGAPMDWSTMKSYTTINTIVWIVALVVIVALQFPLKKYWESVLKYGSAFLAVIQLVAIMTLVINAINADTVNTDNLVMSGEKQYQVASKDNVIVLVLDTVGTTQIDNALKQYPDMLRGFEDFTYYDNADCKYYCTFPSMTHLLTGNEFDFNSESGAWMDASWNSDKSKNFYKKLHDKGYDCRLYSLEVPYVYGSYSNLYTGYDNIEEHETEVDNNTLLKKLIKLSAYRYAPYAVKPKLEVITSEFDSVISIKDGVDTTDTNSVFYAQLKEKGLTKDGDKDKAFIIEHLFGTHKPYTTDENGNEVAEATANQTVAGCMKILGEYISQLKKLGLYDDANIIIMSDHGSWYQDDEQPLFMVKKAHEANTTMVKNSAPVSYEDFQATILSIIGEDYKDYGTSIWDWKEGQERTRTVYMRGSNSNYPEVTGSSFNVYYAYTYKTNKAELMKKVDAGPDEVKAATPWQ